VILSSVIVFGTCASVTAPHKLERVRLASAISISTSLLTTLSIIVTLVLQVLIFLNSKLTPVFCLNNHIQVVHTLLAVFISQAVHQVAIVYVSLPKLLFLVRVIFAPAISFQFKYQAVVSFALTFTVLPPHHQAGVE